jgi:hypothetical protein
MDIDAGLIDFEFEGRTRTEKRRGKVRIPARLLPRLRRAKRRQVAAVGSIATALIPNV